MTSSAKILIGMIVTTLLAAVLYWPGGFGARCAAVADAVAAFARKDMSVLPGDPVPVAAGPEASAAACQKAIDAVTSFNGIKFAGRTDKITPDSVPAIKSVAEAIKACGSVKVELGGHTDRLGDAAENLILSKGRSQAVLNALTADGVDGSVLTTEAYGETRPLEPDAREDNPADNRVTLTVLGAAAPVAQQME